jgi:hypothetical protein
MSSRLRADVAIPNYNTENFTLLRRLLHCSHGELTWCEKETRYPCGFCRWTIAAIWNSACDRPR